MVAYVSRGVRSAMAIVYADESSQGPRLKLALVLEDLIGLHDGHRELPGGASTKVAVPQQTITSLIASTTTGSRAPAAGQQVHQ